MRRMEDYERPDSRNGDQEKWRGKWHNTTFGGFSTVAQINEKRKSNGLELMEFRTIKPRKE